jgi:predicted TPR repeat methyltransferase
VLAAVRRSLRDRGWIVFTVEELADDSMLPHRLRPNGRYAHSRFHVEAALEQAGLSFLDADMVTLRMEAGKPVAGLIVTAKVPS